MTAFDSTPTTQLEVKGISKSFGPVVALEGVSFRGSSGQVVALLGDNGAGKSTLVKVLSGMIQPDAGEILLDGKPVHLTSPKEARSLGIETLHQHLALAPNLDVAANFFLNREVRHSNPVLRAVGWLDNKTMRSRAAEVLMRLNVRIPNVRMAVEGLSGGQRQGIAVGRAIGFDSRIVLMDEPAAALGVEQTGVVLDLINELREQGHLVVLITHNMQEVMDVCTHAVILRRGAVATNLKVSDVTSRDLVDYITGARS